MKAQKIISREKGLYKSPLFFPFIIELLIVSPCPLPFVIGLISILSFFIFFLDLGFQVRDFKGENFLDWNVNYILSLYILLRFLIISRVFLNLTSYCNYRTSRIGYSFLKK